MVFVEVELMDLDTVKRIAYKWSTENSNLKPMIGDARVITGDYIVDSRIYHFEKASGIELDVSGLNLITGYKIVDEEKFAWCVLRYS
jgi:hypothetical protein